MFCQSTKIPTDYFKVHNLPVNHIKITAHSTLKTYMMFLRTSPWKSDCTTTEW